jgi:hypothetical protein
MRVHRRRVLQLATVVAALPAVSRNGSGASQKFPPIDGGRLLERQMAGFLRFRI